ncbi:hypothetical protein T484DRAFT_1860040 [Baffinella frigidus]|nr:hypothetical protein T484DRAFT_1860040 [Cryptophyta sp. CCMP2293]
MPRPANNSGNLGEGAKACLTPGVRPKSATNWHQKNLDKIAELAGAAQQRRVATASSDRTRSRPGSAASFKSTRPRAPLYPFESPRGAQTAGQAGVARCHFADSPSSPPRDSDASNASTNLGATPDHSMSSTRSYSDAGRVEVEQGVERLILEADSHPPPNAQSASRTYAAREAPPIASERTRPASARTASVRAGSSGGVRSLRSAGSQGSAASGSVRAPRPDYASRELFTAGFSATGMPMTSMRSPRLSRAADRAANAQAQHPPAEPPRAPQAIEERSAAPRPRSAATPASHRPGQVCTCQ